MVATIPALPTQAEALPGGAGAESPPWRRAREARVTILQQRRLLGRPQTLQPASHRHLPSAQQRARPLPWQLLGRGSLPDDPEGILGIYF